jgi:hypothetical protein
MKLNFIHKTNHVAIRIGSLALALSISALVSSAPSPVKVSYRIENGVPKIVSAQPAPTLFSQLQGSSPKGTLIRSSPYYITHATEKFGSPNAHDDQAVWYEERLFDSAHVPAEARQIQILNAPLASEFRTIRLQGPASNRINLTILGDGYTDAEKEKFFDDAERTTKGLFEGNTFASYLPLFNVYAVFVSSAESGIGDGQPKNTAFKLYRSPAGSKRAIMPGNESAMEAALRLAPATDYPIVLANDEFYGGLGGRWAISTSSVVSGLIVLRHELGHNFGEVGEEYDNGQVYRGANSSRSANSLPWRHWVAGNTEVHEGKLLSGDYIWKNLSQGAYETNLKMPSSPSSLILEISTVGWSTSTDVEIKVNNQIIPYDGIFHKDRSFFTINLGNRVANESLSLKISEKNRDGDNVLGFALAYAYPPQYDFTPSKVGAFASFSEMGLRSYRPTHDSCLMKDMRKETFCSVDQENMWEKFLNRVSLIDDVVITQNTNLKTATLKTVPLSGLTIKWFEKSGPSWVEIQNLKGQTEWSVASNSPAQTYKVEVAFESTEIRKKMARQLVTKEFRF